MPECEYCGESLPTEEEYLRHLDDAHREDLGPIERRRVAALDDAEGGLEIPTGPAVLGGVLLIALAIVVYVILFFGGSAATGPQHGHGLANVTILGDRVDFSQPQYQMQADFFHFEPINGQPNGRIWHTHTNGVTLAEAMSTVGVDLEPGSVTFNGTTYRDENSRYDVRIEVDGESVDPTSHVLVGVADPENAASGDEIHIVVTETSQTG